MKIGFIGIGNMGHGMCCNLLKAGHTVNVFDVNTALLDEMCKQEGTVRMSSNKEVGEKSDVVITVLPNGKIVNQVVFGKDGLAEGMTAGKVLLECSTIFVTEAQEVASKLADMGITMLDSPISGGPEGAEAGTLSIMIGGDEEAYKKYEEIFNAMGREIVYMGQSGNGQLTKLINQLLYDINTAALCEVMSFAAKLGLDPTRTARIVNTGSGRSNASNYFLNDILEGNFHHGYVMGSAYKDIVNASVLSYKEKIPMPILGAAGATYQMALCMGYENESKAAMVKVYESLNHLEVRK